MVQSMGVSLNICISGLPGLWLWRCPRAHCFRSFCLSARLSPELLWSFQFRPCCSWKELHKIDSSGLLVGLLHTQNQLGERSAEWRCMYQGWISWKFRSVGMETFLSFYSILSQFDRDWSWKEFPWISLLYYSVSINQTRGGPVLG